MRFENLEGKPERECPKRTISSSGGLGLLEWYQSQTSGDVPARTLFPEVGVDTRRFASKDAGPRNLVGFTSIRERNECQRGRWALKWGGL